MVLLERIAAVGTVEISKMIYRVIQHIMGFGGGGGGGYSSLQDPDI